MSVGYCGEEAGRRPGGWHHARMSEATSTSDYQPVLAFWLGDAFTQPWPAPDTQKQWFSGGEALDAAINQRFAPQVRAALEGGLTDWEAAPASRLALIILLDQFTRNVFRGQPEAFSGDPRAQRLATSAIDYGWDAQLPIAARIFVYMPLMHAEDLPLQERCVALFQQLQRGAPPDLQQRLQSNMDFARSHRDIVARFGRFPYRNAVLGRASTGEEQEFLKNGPRFGQ
jgi:uncharacterized protein (DUF924 family)